MRSVSEQMKKLFKNTDADVVFIMNTGIEDSNFLYLTGFTGGVFEYNTLIATKRELILPISVLEYEIAKAQRPKEMKVIKIESRKEVDAILRRYMKGKVVGVNASFLPYNYYKALRKRAKPKKIIDVSKAFWNARSVKGKDELDNIRIANKIAKGALFAVKAELKTGMTEKEVAGRLEYLMMRAGADGSSFKSIVSFNENAALPHHMPVDKRLSPNSIVLIDMGAKYRNYCSDITRTFMFKPDKSSARYKRFAEIYRIVADAQRIGNMMIREGIQGRKVHNAAAEHIDRAQDGKYKGLFIHSLGHAIGIDVHDAGPGLYSNETAKLKAGMVVSNEPGIYVVGFGGVRIEDDVIVGRKSCLVL